MNESMLEKRIEELLTFEESLIVEEPVWQLAVSGLRVFSRWSIPIWRVAFVSAGRLQVGLCFASAKLEA